MSFLNFFNPKKEQTSKAESMFMVSYATIDKIDRATVRLLVEVVSFEESNVSNFDHIPTFEGFLLPEELPHDIKEGELIKVKHDGLSVFNYVGRCVDECNARKKIVSDRATNVLAHAHRE